MRTDLEVGVVESPITLLSKTDNGSPLAVVEGRLELQVDAALKLRSIPRHGESVGWAVVGP